MGGYDYAERFISNKYFNLDWGIFLREEAE
jgi:hypothetical protein